MRQSSCFTPEQRLLYPEEVQDNTQAVIFFVGNGLFAATPAATSLIGSPTALLLRLRDKFIIRFLTARGQYEESLIN